MRWMPYYLVPIENGLDGQQPKIMQASLSNETGQEQIFGDARPEVKENMTPPRFFIFP
jgi:hypothetical protein